ncbi:MAG: DEAD/DEAH box helicase, partial [Pseudomonadota bacterium]|nr:DEAD/DEAH box helicase [Pseudomonadota bacterium]
MYDLIGSHMRLKHIYRGYIESAFPLRFEALNKERERLLNNEDLDGAHLTQPPLIEPMPVYPSSGRTLRQTAAALGQEYEGFEVLARDLVPQGVELYEHQDRSLATALSDKDLVVTTGTGSGKTECFLLPLFAELAREMGSWPDMGQAEPGREWWREPEEERGTPKRKVGQFEHSRRPHAMRALILYPLNALVEDQLRRLRRALDNPETTRWLDNERGRNRILFGRYTGPTPVSGQPGNRAKTKELARALRDIHRREQAIQDKLDLAEGLEKKHLEEVRYFFPALDSGEMWSRWDMQETPPDILITNYSMLNIMLNRQVEEQIFEQTRDWLSQDSANRFHLIVDELHAYRGTQGTEVGYVLRLLLHRLGLTPELDQLRILTTSASIEEDDKSRRFLEEFFGRPRDRFVIVNNPQIDPKRGARELLSLNAGAFQGFCEAIDAASLAALGPDHVPWRPPVDAPEEIASAMTKLALELADVDKRQTDRHVLLGTALQKIDAGDALRDAVREAAGGQVRAVPLTRLDQILFDASAPPWNPFATEPAAGVSKPLRGLLLALALSRRGEQDDRSVTPVRGHLFYHNHQNLWACSNPDCDDPDCLPEERARDGETNPPIGALHATHKLSCSCGGRVLDLVVCECCGEVFLGGHVSPGPHGHNEILTADTGLKTLSSELERKTNASYRLFWPRSDQTPAQGFDNYTADKRRHRWNEAHLHPYSGLLCGSVVPGAESLSGWVYRVDPDSDKVPAMPPKCPNCDADYRRRDRNPTPLRNHRTGFQKACQVLSTGLAREMPQGGERPERKLVLFTDSRQDAAKLAAGVENDHYRDLIRIAMLGAPRTFWEPFVAMLARLVTKVPALLDRLATNPQLQEDVEAQRCMGAPMEYLDRKGRAAAAADRGIASVLKGWALDMEPDDPEVEKRLHRMIASYPHSMPLTAVRDAVLTTLLRRGVHPGGIVYCWQSFRDQGGKRHHWYELFAWPDDVDEAPIKGAELPPEGDSLYASLSLALLAELMYALFPHRARTAEGLGQAWVSCHDLGGLGDKLRQAVDTSIRMLGERRIHRLRGYTAAGQRWNTDGNEDKFPSWVGQYLANVGVPSNTVKQTLKDRGAIVGGHYNCRLAPDVLTMRLPEPGEGGEVSGWRCPHCRTFYLQPSNGVCHHCSGDLVKSPRPQVFDYYVYLSDHSGPAFRFNVAELTGQTDKDQRLDRQCRFQEIFLEEEPKQPTGIDMLSVTTTMEAGVDIGGLQAVMLANMPPRRFNYQQRVGRAGRRGAGLSLALTFCRGRSHDDFYYRRPMAMTGDPPPPPYVDVNRE